MLFTCFLVPSEIGVGNDFDGTIDQSSERIFTLDKKFFGRGVFEPLRVMCFAGLLKQSIHIFHVLQKILKVFLLGNGDITKPDRFEVG